MTGPNPDGTIDGRDRVHVAMKYSGLSTILFLRNTQDNAIGATYYDMLTQYGIVTDTATVNSTLAGTEIQWTKTAGGSVIQWISGRTPAAGFRLQNADISMWAKDDSGLTNIGGRYRIFKRAADTTETELGGGPFDLGSEFTTSLVEYVWTGDVTDTDFVENDRILLKAYITNIGIMAVGTGTLEFNMTDANIGDSLLRIFPPVVFKAEGAVAVTPVLLNMMGRGLGWGLGSGVG